MQEAQTQCREGLGATGVTLLVVLELPTNFPELFLVTGFVSETPPVLPPSTFFALAVVGFIKLEVDLLDAEEDFALGNVLVVPRESEEATTPLPLIEDKG